MCQELLELLVGKWMQKRVVNHEIVGYYHFGLITSKLHQKLFEHQRKNNTNIENALSFWKYHAKNIQC